MFEEALFKHIRDNFSDANFTNITFGFGEVPEATKAPYIVQFGLNAGGDAQFLCNDNDFTDGNAFIQWNIYHPDFTNAFYLKNKLMSFIGQLKTLDFNSSKYVIQLNEEESSPSGLALNNGLAAETVVRSFTYNLQ